MAKKTTPVKNPRGRPSQFCEDVVERICIAIAEGAALHVICQQDDFPVESTVYKWLDKNPDFAKRYARARERQAERGVDEMRVIADTATDASKARNQIDVRKWAASKLLPKKYGEKVEVSGNPESPISVMLNAVQGSAIKPVGK